MWSLPLSTSLFFSPFEFFGRLLAFRPRLLPRRPVSSPISRPVSSPACAPSPPSLQVQTALCGPSGALFLGSKACKCLRGGHTRAQWLSEVSEGADSVGVDGARGLWQAGSAARRVGQRAGSEKGSREREDTSLGLSEMEGGAAGAGGGLTKGSRSPQPPSVASRSNASSAPAASHQWRSLLELAVSAGFALFHPAAQPRFISDATWRRRPEAATVVAQGG